MGTLKTIVGIGVVTGVVVYAFARSISGKIDRRLARPEKLNPQLV